MTTEIPATNTHPPQPQLVVTLSGGEVHLDSTHALPVTSPHPFGDTEGTLAAIGRWLFQARRHAAQEG